MNQNAVGKKKKDKKKKDASHLNETQAIIISVSKKKNKRKKFHEKDMPIRVARAAMLSTRRKLHRAKPRICTVLSSHRAQRTHWLRLRICTCGRTRACRDRRTRLRRSVSRTHAHARRTMWMKDSGCILEGQKEMSTIIPQTDQKKNEWKHPRTALIGDRPDIRLDNEEEDDDRLGASPIVK